MIRNKKVLIQLHPQLGYLARICRHIASIEGSAKIYISTFYTSSNQLNIKLYSFCKRFNIIQSFLGVKDEVIFLKFSLEVIKYFSVGLFKSNCHALALNAADKTQLLMAAHDTLMRRKANKYQKSSYAQRKKMLLVQYKRTIALYSFYYSMIGRLDIKRVYLSHGHYTEYVALLLASLRQNVETYVVQGSTGPFYKINYLSCHQPGFASTHKYLSRLLCLIHARSDALTSSDIGNSSQFLHYINSSYGVRSAKNSIIVTMINLLVASNSSYEELLANKSLRPTFIVALHCLSDQNFNFAIDSGLFLNYVSWTENILKAIDRSARVIIKMHPHSENYGELEVLTSLISKYNHTDSIEVVRPEETLTKERLEGSKPILITCNGTVAIESSLIGVKAITCGTSFVEDAKVIRCSSIDMFNELVGNWSKACQAIIKSTNSDPNASNQQAASILDLLTATSAVSSYDILKKIDRYFFFDRPNENNSLDDLANYYKIFCKEISFLQLKTDQYDFLVDAGTLL